MDYNQAHSIIFDYQDNAIGHALRQLIIRERGQLPRDFYWWDYVHTATFDKRCGLCDRTFAEKPLETIAEHAMQHIKEHNILALL